MNTEIPCIPRVRPPSTRRRDFDHRVMGGPSNPASVENASSTGLCRLYSDYRLARAGRAAAPLTGSREEHKGVSRGTLVRALGSLVDAVVSFAAHSETAEGREERKQGAKVTVRVRVQMMKKPVGYEPGRTMQATVDLRGGFAFCVRWYLQGQRVPHPHPPTLPLPRIPRVVSTANLRGKSFSGDDPIQPGVLGVIGLNRIRLRGGRVTSDTPFLPSFVGPIRNQQSTISGGDPEATTADL